MADRENSAASTHLKGDYTLDCESHLYCAKALANLINGGGIEIFSDSASEVQDGVLWLLAREIDQLGAAYYAESRSKRHELRAVRSKLKEQNVRPDSGAADVEAGPHLFTVEFPNVDENEPSQLRSCAASLEKSAAALRALTGGETEAPGKSHQPVALGAQLLDSLASAMRQAAEARA